MSNATLLTPEQLGQGTQNHGSFSARIDDLPLWAPYNVHTLGATTAIELTGLDNPRPGRRVTLVHSGGFPITLLNGDGRSSLPNRLRTPGNLDYVLNPDASVNLVYDSTLSGGRWIVSDEPLDDVARTGDYGDLSNIPPQLYRFLDTNTSSTNGTSDQQWFSSNGAVTLAADTFYRFWGQLRIGPVANLHNIKAGFGGTVGVRDISWTSIGTRTTLNATATSMVESMRSTTTTVLTTVGNSATGSLVRVEGVLRTSTAGTFIPLFAYSAAPGGFPTVYAGTHFEMIEVDAYTATTRGTWS